MFETFEIQGFTLLDNLFSEEENEQLFAVLRSTRLSRAGMGKAKIIDDSKRGDSISWIEDYSTLPFLHRHLEEIKQTLNRTYFLNLKEFEIHFSHYSPGAHYERHVDAFSNDEARTLSFVHYLNRNWTPSHGGELILYRDSRPEVRVAPRWGNSIFFLSNMPHEVLTTHVDRFSVTGWFRR